jgi:hypothetical protein
MYQEVHREIVECVKVMFVLKESPGGFDWMQLQETSLHERALSNTVYYAHLIEYDLR